MSNCDPCRCPLCGRDNACVMTRGAADAAACWCGPITIPAATLSRIPAAALGKACVCPQCAAALGDGVELATDPGGRPRYVLTHGDDRLTLAADGAQVLSWRHRGREILWQASAPEFAPGKPVRGGVPLVFPWFGDDPERRGRPAHGFARNRRWQLAAGRTAAGVTLYLGSQPADAGLWPHAFHAEFEVRLAPEPTIRWRVHNVGTTTWSFEQALHTYFAVGDIATAEVRGLQGLPYEEQASEPELGPDPHAPLRFVAETDRVFQDVPNRIDLLAPSLKHRVELHADGARSAIVWTPWPNKAARLAQLAPDDWRRFVCIETANVGRNAVTLAPGAAHELTLRLRVADLD